MSLTAMCSFAFFFLCATKAMPLGVSIIQLVFIPPVVLLAASLALFNFQNAFRLISTNLSGYMTIPIVKSLRPYISNVRYAMEQVLGKASSLKFNLSHVLAMGLIIMLLAIYNAIQRGNQLQEQRIKLELARKKHRD
ncbi:hypothetical protein Poli38472_007441 [Pythium oligandrum]|uniref:Endoplasmic reticulum transmembrane protein n=1 Tax=Pythium oligandrum TaxID=41045 RepID=A0A8K1FNX0_PYTOL|nr:hypothetical protein Poli38472_007441 [Pythium oligandrum]|eukprot:TMW67769.1 hypothetical protein Poli38472_007441 [Pythium oligandrum]